MAKIQLLIEIEERLYKNIIDNDKDDEEFEAMDMAFCNAKPLPKGHGDLIDRNDLLKHYDSTTYHNGIEERKIHFVQIGYVNDAPTIIGADGGGENEETK